MADGRLRAKATDDRQVGTSYSETSFVLSENKLILNPVFLLIENKSTSRSSFKRQALRRFTIVFHSRKFPDEEQRIYLLAMNVEAARTMADGILEGISIRRVETASGRGSRSYPDARLLHGEFLALPAPPLARRR